MRICTLVDPASSDEVRGSEDTGLGTMNNLTGRLAALADVTQCTGIGVKATTSMTITSCTMRKRLTVMM